MKEVLLMAAVIFVQMLVAIPAQAAQVYVVNNSRSHVEVVAHMINASTGKEVVGAMVVKKYDTYTWEDYTSKLTGEVYVEELTSNNNQEHIFKCTSWPSADKKKYFVRVTINENESCEFKFRN